MEASGEEFGVPVVCVEEQMRGWLAEIKRRRNLRDQIAIYDRLARKFAFFAQWQIVTIDITVSDLFESLRRQRIRIGPMDLKIAAIALARDPLLLSANLSDYRQVPNLRVKNWLT
jgi:tRNA(fMet)-specific endonuclease VapC